MSIEEGLYPRIATSFTNVGAEFPLFLARNFARILQRIELLWGEKEANVYIDSLFLDVTHDDTAKLSDRITRTRQGFPIEAMKEIVLLKQVHQLQFPSTSFDPYDPFSGSEIVQIAVPAKTEDQPDEAASSKKRQINWPIIRTQYDLTESARQQQGGEQVYPLQGRPIGEILMHYGVIDEDTLRIVRNMQNRPAHKNRPLGEILLDIGIIKQDELTRTLLLQAGIPMVDVLSIDIPPEVTKTVPHAKAREKLAVPVGHYLDTLYLAVADPFSFRDNAFFTMMTRMKIGLVYAPVHEIVNRLNLHGISKMSMMPTNKIA